VLSASTLCRADDKVVLDAVVGVALAHLLRGLAILSTLESPISAPPIAATAPSLRRWWKAVQT
jgi:hypothetical protein